MSRGLMEEFSSRRQTHLGADRAARAPSSRRSTGTRRTRGRSARCASGPTTRAAAARTLSRSTWPRRRGGGRRRPAPARRARWSRSCQRVTTRRGPGAAAPAEPRPIWELTPEQEADLMAQALARLQEAQPTWRKADLIRHLGELLPDDVACRDDAAAAALLTAPGGAGAGRRRGGAGAGAGSAGVAAGTGLAAPGGRAQHLPPAQRNPVRGAGAAHHGGAAGWPRLSSRARRALRLSWRRACSAQTRLSWRLSCAPRRRPPSAAQQTTGSGLRLDQAAAAFLAVTSDRRAEILVGPAGSGKTRTAAAGRRAVAAGGHGRGVRADHLPGRPQRAARGRGGPGRQHRRVPRPPATAAAKPAGRKHGPAGNAAAAG